MTTATEAIPHGTISGRKYHRCNCPRCRTSYGHYSSSRRRSIAYGRWQPYIDAAPVIAHVRALQQAGVGWERTAALAGVAQSTIRDLLYDVAGRTRTTKVRPETATKILAVRPDQLADGRQIDAIGVHRRIQALVAIGWTQDAMAPYFGVISNKVSQLLRNKKAFVRTARRVAEGYDQLWDQRPEDHGVKPKYAEQARARAARLGWVPPLAWDENIDDPAALPDPEGRRGPTAEAAEIEAEREALREDARLLTVRGYPAEIIAHRLGVSERTVVRWRVANGWRAAA